MSQLLANGRGLGRKNKQTNKQIGGDQLEGEAQDLPTSCAAFSQSFTVNWFRWRSRGEQPGDPKRIDRDGTSSIKCLNKQPRTMKYQGLGTRQAWIVDAVKFWNDFRAYSYR